MSNFNHLPPDRQEYFRYWEQRNLALLERAKNTGPLALLLAVAREEEARLNSLHAEMRAPVAQSGRATAS